MQNNLEMLKNRKHEQDLVCGRRVFESDLIGIFKYTSVGESWYNEKFLFLIYIKFNFIYIMLIYKSHDI